MAAGELLAGAVIGAVAGHAVDEVEDRVENVFGASSHGDIPDHYRMIIHLLSGIEAGVRKQTKQLAPDLTQQVVLVNNSSVDFNNRGYKHVFLLASVSFKLDYFTAAGKIQYQTVVGWNNFDLPMKCQVQIDPTDIASTIVMLYFSNEDKHLPGLTS